jgi:ribonuclease VapC
MPDDVVSAMLTPLPITLVEADVEHFWEAVRLRSLTVEAGLSLVDRFCLALAKREKLPAWTSDRKWREIADAVRVTVVAIR